MRCLLKCEKRKYTDGRNLERRGVKMWNEEADVECENKRTIENSLVPSLSDLSARNKNSDHTGTFRSAPIISNRAAGEERDCSAAVGRVERGSRSAGVLR